MTDWHAIRLSSLGVPVTKRKCRAGLALCPICLT